jgi:hypothetical protein
LQEAAPNQPREPTRPFRAALGLLVRIANSCSLLLAASFLLLAIGTASRALRFSHGYNLPKPNWVQGQIRLEFARGGLWILHLYTHPQGVTPRMAPFDPPYWTVTTPDPNWLDRLSLAQTGPFRLGFCSHLRHVERTEPVIDNRTGRRSEVTLVEEERITRVPLIAIILALLILPTLRLVQFVWCWRNRACDRRQPLARFARRLFTLVATISALMFAFTLWQCLRVKSPETSLGWNSQSGVGSPNIYLNRTFIANRKSWQFSRVSNVVDPHMGNDATHFIGVSDLRLFSSPQKPFSAPSSSLLGFAFAREDVSLPTSLYGQPTRRIGWSMLIPNWAVLLTFSLLPAAWFYRRWMPRHRRAHRIKHGLCITCGYDLRGSPARCPECGAEPASMLAGSKGFSIRLEEV